MSENGAEVRILRYLAGGKQLLVGNHVHGSEACKEAAEYVGLTPGQVLGAIKNMVDKDYVERKATDTPGLFRILPTGDGSRRLARVIKAQERRAERAGLSLTAS